MPKETTFILLRAQGANGTEIIINGPSYFPSGACFKFFEDFNTDDAYFYLSVVWKYEGCLLKHALLISSLLSFNIRN